MAIQAINAMDSGELLIMVDTEASKENVGRAVERVGWTVRSVAEEGEEFHLTLVKE
jgi:KaiC/GvpD/RAD55 family RecA-like ATPase